MTSTTTLSSMTTASTTAIPSSSVDARSGQTAGQFASSLVVAIVTFAVQVIVFLLIKDRLARIYQPRTYLVPERERTKPVVPGWWAWIKPVLSTSNSEFVQKCGLDAYFFLRYLRMLLKIFVPAAIVILPILLPLNAVGGKGPDWTVEIEENGQQVLQSASVTGLDQLAWGNVRPFHARRYWAHWILAVLLIIHVCYVSFSELRNYVRMRQAYLTSPQHRLRASATTVLVGSVPDKWLTVEELDGLFDVFPGGVRNIWLNRNFDELSEKISRRDNLASKLESAETDLIKNCFKKNQEQISKAEKAAGKQRSKKEKQQQSDAMDERGRQQAQGQGLDSGNPHQVRHTLQDALDEEEDGKSVHSSADSDLQRGKQKQSTAIPLIGGGIQSIGHGFNQITKGFVAGLRDVNKHINDGVNTTNGFAASEEAGEGTTPLHTTTHSHPSRAGLTMQAHGERVQGQDGRREPVSIPAEMSPVTPTAFDGGSDRSRIPSQPENDQLPLTRPDSPGRGDADAAVADNKPETPSAFQKFKTLIGMGKAKEPAAPVEYARAFDDQFVKDAEDAVWKKYLREKDRDTMRLPIFGWQWMPSLPWLGEKVDTIYYCRQEVARLNVEIEDDQAHPERFPLMNSAFIQFNHQVAAHMACQAVSHHLPKQMAPRIVEMDPTDVIWDNMSIPWWQTYIRTAGVVAVVILMIVLWAVPVAFTSALSQLSVAAQTYPWLAFMLRAPATVRSILQGVLPPVLLALLMFLLPVTLRFLSRLQGMQSGVLVELSVQRYYFFFLFVQIFLVVTIANLVVTGLQVFQSINDVSKIPQILGENIPKASNYFFSYMLLQALSVSAGALVQIGGLIGWFVLAPIFDSTARAKFQRQTQLSDIQWGTFFPVYTNLACIGLIYAVVAPLILIFNIITFSLFWFVYRYQTLYVTKFTLDTGGLLFPNAINTTYVGVYVMEIALIGLFFLVRDEAGQVAASGQGIGMIVVLILTAGYHYLLNEAFRPLFQYIPITLEDDAVRRDEEFARAMHARHGHVVDDVEQDDDDDIEDRLKDDERSSLEEDRQAHEYEMQAIESDKRRRAQTRQPSRYDEKNVQLQNPEVFVDIDRENKSLAFMRKTANKTADVTLHKLPGTLGIPQANRGQRKSWADRSNPRHRRASTTSGSPQATRQSTYSDPKNRSGKSEQKPLPQRQVLDLINNFNPVAGDVKDLEAQQKARDQLADALFAGVNDELEDLTPEQRDTLVQRAFQHSALRARRPVVWLPRDELGVSDDELTRMAKFSEYLWVSNVRQGLDGKGRTVYSGAPPDFSEIDVIKL